MIVTPKRIIIEEDFPLTVSQWRVIAKNLGGTEIAAALYPVTGNITDIPIGTNGFWSPVPDGTVVNLFVQAIAAPGHGDNPLAKMAPDGPFSVTYLADGPKSITVIV